MEPFQTKTPAAGALCVASDTFGIPCCKPVVYPISVCSEYRFFLLFERKFHWNVGVVVRWLTSSVCSVHRVHEHIQYFNKSRLYLK